MMFCIRGAFCVDEPTADGVEHQATGRLHVVMSELMKKNRIAIKHIRSIFFTQTTDITQCNIASCLRKRPGYERIALFTTQEVSHDGKSALPRTVRIMVLGEKFLCRLPNVPVYMFGAQQLRTDLFSSGAER